MMRKYIHTRCNIFVTLNKILLSYAHNSLNITLQLTQDFMIDQVLSSIKKSF